MVKKVKISLLWGAAERRSCFLSKECREIQDLCNEWMEARKAMFGEQRGWREGKTKKERQILEWACGQRGSRVCRGAEMSLDVSAAGQPLAPRPTIRWRFDVSGRTDPVIKQGSRRSQLLPIGRTRPCFSSISTELAKCSWKRTLERVICGPVPRNASAHLGSGTAAFLVFCHQTLPALESTPRHIECHTHKRQAISTEHRGSTAAKRCKAELLAVPCFWTCWSGPTWVQNRDELALRPAESLT